MPISLQDSETIYTLEDALKLNISVSVLLSGKENVRISKFYALFTLISYLLDCLCFAVQYKWFIDSNYDSTNVWMMAASLAMLVWDTFYLIYLLALSRSMPKEIKSWLWESIMGDTAKVERIIK